MECTYTYLHIVVLSDVLRYMLSDISLVHGQELRSYGDCIENTAQLLDHYIQHRHFGGYLSLDVTVLLLCDFPLYVFCFP